MECGGLAPRDDVIRALRSRVDPTTPRAIAPLSRRRQLKIQWFPVSIQDEVQENPLLTKLRGKREGVRPVTPVGLTEPHSVPDFARLPDQPVEAPPFILMSC